MGQSLEALGRRTASMQGIRSVVHTMKSLSVINAAPYEQAAIAIEAYHDTVLLGLHAFLSQLGSVGASTEDAATQVLVVFGSDHGLCGNYNESLASQVQLHTASRIGHAPNILCVGAQMADALTDQNQCVEKTFFPPASIDGIGRLANTLTQELDRIRENNSGDEIAVTLAYSSRSEGGTQAAEIAPLLPLDPELVCELQAKPWVSRSLPYFPMPAEKAFVSLIREHLFASLFRAAAEALVTENAARLALMQQAEQSVDDRLDALKSETRALRQTEITTELLDVIIGFEALKKDRRSDDDVGSADTD